MICTSLSLSQNIPDTYNAQTLQACDTTHTSFDHITQQLHIGISTNQNLHIHFYE